ncbi:MAG: glycosyltransferase [Clostridium sp.]
MSVDIIIPIYNAYEYTVECINSVLKYTSKEDYNLILINDKSTDTKVKEYLDKLKNKNISNIFVYHNEENLGFVGTVNRGMSYSDNDIVLLNSDTEVTRGWLNKIKRAAYSNEHIATVTPLTNSGTICSIPIFCKDNDIPSKFSIEEYADIIEKTSLRMYPSIPTAVGFCMYIKRKAIDEIGLFDADTFGKGYGEENDFCCRALEKGYTHVLCDDTFIYHKGSASFNENKKEFIENNLKILFNRYPYYPKMVEEFIAKNPLKDIQDNVKLQIKLRNDKKNILYVVHNDFIKGENHPVGGTEFHVKDIIENAESCNGYVMFVKGNQIVVEAFIDNEITKFKFELSDTISTFNFSLNSYKNKIGDILDYFNIDLVHIHHLKTHTFDIVDVAKEKSIPVYLTIHDFYLACPCVNLLYKGKQYCKGIRSKEVCQKCIKSYFGYNSDFISSWNDEVMSMINKVDKIFVPSESTKRIFEEYYTDIYGKVNFNIQVIEHGIDKCKEQYNIDTADSDKFKIAFIGGLSMNKGSGIIHDLIKNNKNKNIEWHLFGNIGDQRLNLLNRSDLIKHGRYERDEIGKLLINDSINLVCIISIWPETYSYTLSEAIAAGIPVMVTDIGALGERVKKYDIGWSVDYNANHKEILEKINQIINNKDDYLSKYKNVRKVELHTKKQMADYYEKLYLEGDKSKLKILEEANVKNTLLSYKINNINIITSDNSDMIVVSELDKKVKQLENELNLMRSTLGWKLMEYIRNTMPEGLKKIGKKIVYFCVRFKNK